MPIFILELVRQDLGFSEPIEQIAMTFDDIETALANMTSTDVAERASAIVALGKLRSPRAFEALIDALDDPVPFVSLLAAGALGHLGDSRAVGALISRFDRLVEVAIANFAQDLEDFATSQPSLS